MSDSLNSWLARLEQLHPKEVDLGLERVAKVRDRIGFRQDLRIISVGGTNGKGSTCAMLEAIYIRAGFKVGLYTSPHLVKYNERIRVNGSEATDQELIEAFENVEAARGDVPLTYFEFGTLAAHVVFCNNEVDVAILEVGLGGRLDAVNAFEPDCSLVLNVAIDHVDFLGNSREAIGREKAGIFREGKPAICAEEEPPRSLVEGARAIGAELHLAGRDFGHTRLAGGWQFWNFAGKKSGLPFPGMRGAVQLYNAAAAVECVQVMRDNFPVDMAAVRGGLLDASLPGRFQVLPGSPQVILDVAHNEAAAKVLLADLRAQPCTGKTIAVFGVLADKQIDRIAAAVAPAIDQWFACSLPVPRAANAGVVAPIIEQCAINAPLVECDSVEQGWASATKVAQGNDRILVFGSFYTVSEALETIGRESAGSRENGESDK